MQWNQQRQFSSGKQLGNRVLLSRPGSTHLLAQAGGLAAGSLRHAPGILHLSLSKGSSTLVCQHMCCDVTCSRCRSCYQRHQLHLPAACCHPPTPHHRRTCRRCRSCANSRSRRSHSAANSCSACLASRTCEAEGQGGTKVGRAVLWQEHGCVASRAVRAAKHVCVACSATCLYPSLQPLPQPTSHPSLNPSASTQQGLTSPSLAPTSARSFSISSLAALKLQGGRQAV